VRVGAAVVGAAIVGDLLVGDIVVGEELVGEGLGVGGGVGERGVFVGEEVSPVMRYMKFFIPAEAVSAAPLTYIVPQLPEEVSIAFQFPCPKKSPGLMEL